MELVLEEMQAERSSNNPGLGFRGVCTYGYDRPQLPLGNTVGGEQVPKWTAVARQRSTDPAPWAVCSSMSTCNSLKQSPAAACTSLVFGHSWDAAHRAEQQSASRGWA